MSTSVTKGERLYIDFRALSQEARDVFLLHLIGDPSVREEFEELLDLEIATERASEPTRPLRDVLNDLGN
jgi:hypothetical protein